MNIVDHIGKLRREHEERGGKLMDKKANLDKYSSDCVENRDYYGTSYCNVSQFNRALASFVRQQFGELRPLLEDFKDTGNTQEDSDVVMGLFNPERYNLQKYAGYNVAKLQGRGRFLFVLKSRDGDDNVDMALRVIGECGHFCEMYTKSEIEADETLYRHITKFEKKLLKEL